MSRVTLQRGVFVGIVSARVRDGLWKLVQGRRRLGACTLIARAQNEQGFTIYTNGDARRVVRDFDGLLLVCVLATTACGGTPFVLADLPDSGSAEIAAPVAIDAGGTPTTQDVAVQDAALKQQDDAPQEAAQDVLQAQDVAAEKPPNTCTPFPSPLLQFGSCTGPIDQPTYFVTIGPSTGCENRVTPIMCTCQETYGCECILKYTPDACGGSRFVQSCGYATGPGGPTSGILIRCTQ